MGRLFTAIVLLLIAGSALAQADLAHMDTKNIIDAAHSLTPPETDYSIAYLSQIFGTVGNVLQGTSGQILGNIFSVFNKGVLIVAALWLVYTGITTVIRASVEGSFMGQNKNVPWIMVRIALGFSLIIPSSTTGYSLLQDLFMKVVIQGVGLADQTWNAALDYIQLGGALYIPPNTMATDPKLVSAALASSTGGGSAPFTQIFQDEVCMIESKKWKEEQDKELNANAQDTTNYTASSTVPPYTAVYDETDGVIKFPGVFSSSDNACGQATRYYQPAPTGQVSSMKAYDVAAMPGLQMKKNYQSVTSISADQQAAMKAYSWSALKQAVLSLMPAAQQYVNLEMWNQQNEISLYSEPIQANAKTVFSALLGYVNLMTPYQRIVAGAANSASLSFISQAKAQGWVMAGGFYWSVEQANSGSTAMDISNLMPTVTGHSGKANSAQDLILSSAKKLLTNDIYVGWINSYWTKYIGAQQNSAENHSLPFGLSTMFDTSKYNPMVALMQTGKSLLQGVVGTWLGAMVLSLGLALGAGICTSTSPFGVVFKAALSWVKSIVMLITTALLVPGAILSYYLPLYPFALYTFAAVGWILMVIEGMAAAPLVCMGLTHPEGHDFLGKAEQALMLFLGIFVRPALMVIGLIAAMLVSFIAFHLLISGVGTVLGDLMGTSASALSVGGAPNAGEIAGAAAGIVFGVPAAIVPALANPLLYLISMTLMMTVFGMISMELVEQSYKLIYQLPNKILTWIGGPQAGEEYGQMAGSIRGAVSSGASQAGQIGGEGLVGGAGVTGEAFGASKKQGGGPSTITGRTSGTPSAPAAGSGSSSTTPPGGSHSSGGGSPSSPPP